MLRFRLLPGALLAALLVVSPADASIVQGLELEELVGHADRIVLGRVLFSESFRRPDGQIGTWHRIGVEREIRGRAPDEQEVIVETLGGHIGDLAMRVEGEPSFTVGERVLVFIRDGGPYTAFRRCRHGTGCDARAHGARRRDRHPEPPGSLADAPQRARVAWRKASARSPTKSASMRSF